MTWYWYEYIKNEKMTLASTALGSNNFIADFKHNLHFVTFCFCVCNVYRNKFFYTLWPDKPSEKDSVENKSFHKTSLREKCPYSESF